MNDKDFEANKSYDKKAELAEAFAIRIVELERLLREKHKERRISDQIFRSGTSIGANIAESKYAESKADFIHKLSISQKEANETLFWLRLLLNTKLISDDLFKSLYNDCSEILRILTTILIKLRSSSDEKTTHS